MSQLQREARLVVDLVESRHYAGATFRQIKGEEIIDRLLNDLDPAGDIFTAQDVRSVHERYDQDLLPTYLARGDLKPAFEVFDRFVSRARDRLRWINRRLEQPFDFSQQETFREPAPGEFPDLDGLAAEQRWELKLKDELLHEMLSGRTEAEARNVVHGLFARWGRRIETFDSFTVREEVFNAALRTFDPHSGYAAADATREFAGEIKGALVGVGIAVDKQRDLCVVTRVYPGSPADLLSTLAPGDVIEAVAEGNEPWVYTSELRLRDIVAKLRGPGRGNLRLAYISGSGGDRKVITLQRTTIVLATTRARAAISQVPSESGRTKPIGWIELPAFYSGGEGADATSVARDVAELIEQMKARHIHGLVLDLRRNPGGAIAEAVALTQLFLSGGNVMFTRGADGVLQSHPLSNAPPLYDGPLVVLTSPRSASAAEIFAGAMRFHHRALVVGGPATFGKGTVQTYIDLAKALNLTGAEAKDWGTLRLTAQRFYTPDGSAVQIRGITPDVVLPEIHSGAAARREATLPHALPPDDIVAPREGSMPVPAPRLPADLRAKLSAEAEVDIALLPEWKLWRHEQELARALSDRRVRTVNGDQRLHEWKISLAVLRNSRAGRRDFAATSGYVTEPVELAAVRAASADHEEMLRASLGLKAHPPRLLRGTLLFEPVPGQLRDLQLQDINFLPFLGDAADLAQAFARASGLEVTAAQMTTLLQQLTQLERKTDKALLATTAKAINAAAGSSAVRSGLEAMLLRLTQLEPELAQDLPSFDIPQRECLRLAASWADRAAGPKR